MKRITIKYWQELPLIIESLKRASSQILFEWQETFNPARSYITSINFEDVRIVFQGEFWRVSTRLYQMFCMEYQLNLNISTYLWLAEHTTIINNSLLGDEVFNHYIKENRGYIEAEEFVENNKLVNWYDEDFELYYNYKDMEMLQRLEMEIRPNRYQYRSKSGYYFPINIHIRYNAILEEWLRGEGKNLNKYQIRHQPRLTIIGVDKSSVFDFARYLYQEKGLSELIIQWVDDKDKTEFTITINETTVIVKDKWREENEEYSTYAQTLNKLSHYQLERFKTQDILNHSTYSDAGIELDEEYYQRLHLTENKVVGKRYKIGDKLYGDTPYALGSPQPIVVQAEELKLKTPYQSVQSGVYKGVLLPITAYGGYNNSQPIKEEWDESDTDIRIVLRKSSVPEQSLEDEEGDLEVLYGKVNERIPLSLYPSVQFEQIPMTIDFTEEIQVQDKRLTYTNQDFYYVPYILDIQPVGEQLQVNYQDGEQINYPLTDENLRVRVVFKDRIGVQLKEGMNHFANLLMSLATDELDKKGLQWLKRIPEDEEVKQILDSWLQALTTRISGNLLYTVQSYDIGEERLLEQEESLDEEFDIFEDIDLL